MMRLTAGGVPLHVQQVGRPGGRDIVAVHGLAADLSFWYLGAAPLLAEQNRVTMYDLRGHGLSGFTEHGYRSTDLARDLLGLIDRLGLDRPLLVGHSYGAAVALHAATLAPTRVGGVVIADGYLPYFEGGPGGRTDRRLQRSVERLRRRGVQLPADLPRVAYAAVQDLLDGGVAAEVGSAGIRRWQQLRERTAAGAEVTDRSLGPRQLAIPATRWLAVYGDRSPCRATLRGIRRVRPDTEVVRIADAGHLHPIRRPEEFADRVQQFLDKAPDRLQLPPGTGSGQVVASDA